MIESEALMASSVEEVAAEEGVREAQGGALKSARAHLKEKLRQHKANTSANRGVHSPILPRSSREADGQPEEAVLSYAQQRLWLMDQLMGAHHAYNISLAIRLSGGLQAGHLRTSLQRILHRHDILRTRYTSHQGQPRLITDPPATLELLPQLVTDEQHIQALWRDERQHAFNLAEEPLIRLRLLEVDSHQHVLLITLHHIIADAWSLGIFFNELITSYRDLSEDKPAGAAAEPLVPLAIQYSDYAHWQRTHLQQDQLRRQCDYWREQLHELPAAIHLPLDFPRPEERRFHGAAAYIHLPAALTTRIRQLGLQTDTTLFMTLFAAFSLLLGRRCGEQDIPIGTPVANRGRRETENLIGFFVNLLVLRSDLSGQPSFNDLLRRTRATVLDAYAHQDIAFEYLVEIIEPERDLNQSPLFQVLFALQNAPAEDIALDQLQMQPLIAEEHEGVARYDLTFNLSETPAGLIGALEYNTDLFTQDSIDNLLNQYQLLLSQIVEQPELCIDDYQLLTERDRQIYLAQTEQTAQTVQTVQAAQDSQHAPDFLHQVNTEVQQQALVLARQLRKEGFTRNDCIGIAADEGDSAHDAHLLVAFLAIRQLGACAYIINSVTNSLRRQALLDAAGVVRVLETVDTSHIRAVNEVVEDAEDEGKLVQITGAGGTTAPVTPDAGLPALRFSIQHASGHLLLAELDQTAFLCAVVRFTGQRAAGQGSTEQVLLSALQVWSRSLSVQELAQFFPVTILEGRQLAPVGSAGELSLAGIHLCASAATVRQTGLTVPHPLFPAQTLIRTGHRVILRQDGSCHADSLSVQNRARRRSQWARQSETLLRSVIPKQLPTLVLQQTQWIAFTQAHAGTAEAEMTLAALLARLKQTPQRHWLPSALQIWDSLPLLDQGAVDRELLKKSSDGNGKLFIPPQGPTEELLAVIWSELLPAHNTERTELAERQIDRRDNFFLIGGYSLIAAQLIARIRDLFQVELPLRELFAHQTLQSQARLIDQQRHSEEVQLPYIVAIPRDATAPLPLSFSQQRLWFLSRMMPPNAVYNIPFALRLRGKVDESALVHSLNAIISRHEALRTRFADVDGQAVQLIDPPGRPCVVVEDIDSEAVLHSRILAERHYCFDLSNEPLVRLRVLNTRFDGHHVLLATFHHIVADGWSMGVFFKELVELYRTTVAAPGAQITPLAPLRLQFADYAHWQRQQLTGNIIAAQLSYWEHQLAGLPPLLDLPTDLPRPAEQRYRGATAMLHLPASLTGELQALNRRSGSTLFMSLIAAFAVLLGRYARQHDIAIGTPVANRRHSETEDLIGFFLNSLVMRFDLQHNPSFTDLLSATRDMALEAYAHQDIPFEHLVERLNPVRSLSHAPLFQVSCSLVNTPVGGQAFPGIDVEPLQVSEEQGVARYDLTFNFSVQADGSLLGSMEYNTDLFKAETIERLLNHYERLLEAVVAAPQEAIGELDFLSDTERQQQLQDWNPAARTDSPQRPTSPDSVHALFARQAQHQPDAIAVVDGAHQISYRELDRRANRLAHYLIAQGVVADNCVGLCVERSADMIVGLLGILKAGAAYVPLDPAYPASRLQHMIATSACKLILSEQHLLEELSFLSDYQTLPLDGHWHHALLGRYSDSAPAVTVVPDQLAYIIFTSGSTGVPKGVLISHANITSLVAPGNSVAVPTGTIVGQAASYAFDAITYELWAPLVAGGRVVMINKATLLSPQALTACLQQQQVSRLFITTALFNRISQEVPNAFASLEQVLFGGEAYSADAIAHILHTAPPAQLLHVYGPTETTTFATGFAIDTRRFLQDRQAPIGMPMTNTTAYVLQGHHLAPLGAVGELCLGGAGLARGYLGDARLSAKKFIPHPFAGSPGERLYRTGDLVRLRPDGAIDFIGRVDDQIKLRGFRIELGEIEQALRQHPGVEQVLVLAREDQPGERRLVAYVVAAEATETTNTTETSTTETTREETTNATATTTLSTTSVAAVLSEHLKGRVPDYAVPGAFVLLDAFPLNHNGKIDRVRLPVPDTNAYAREHYQAPATPLESRLVALWQANLGQTRSTAIGTQDNYFAIGGDSIRSISLVSAARAQGLQFAIKDLFAHPTIAELASVVVDTGVAGTVRADGTIHPAGQGTDTAITSTTTVPFALLSPEEQARLPRSYRGQTIEDAYPLSMLQQGMWFHSMQNPQSAVYHCVITFAIDADWQPALFREALNSVIQRHPVLRTEFHLDADRPLQFVTTWREPTVEVHDLRTRSEQDKEESQSKEAAIEAWVLEEKARGLRIDELWRIGILVFEQQIQFGLSFHHALWDGWSDASLVAELFTHYKTLLQGQPLVVLPSPPSYQTYIALEQAALASPVHRDYWAHSLAGAKQAWWSAHPHQQSRHFFCDITADMSAALIALADQLGVQEKSVWCTVYLVLTSLLEGDDHILGSVVTHGRPEIDGAEKMVGLFLNSLPLQVDIGSGSWADLIRQVHARLNQHQAHRHYPLAQIQADLRLDFAGSLFNFTNFHVIGNAGAASNVTGSGSFGLDETNYLFSVDVQKHDAANRHLLRITLDPTVFDEAFQHRIARYVPHILTTMTQELSLPVNKARLLGEEYRTLMQYSRGEYASPRTASTPVASVCQLFEEQARQQPQAIAIVHGNEQLSYGELNRRANQLAHYLRARGVGTDQLVALCVERSLEMVIGLLGIWKAGGAYVPLDPAYPPERLAYVIEDARPQLILTQASLAARLAARLDAQRSLVLLDQDWPAIAREAASNGAAVALSPQADDLAYVMYTSGSTGQPKGVMVAQRNVLNHNLFVCREFALSASDRILQFATVSFDAAVEEIFPVLMAGGSLILRAALTPSASELSTQVLHQGITVLDLPTAYWHAWIGTVDSDYLGQSALRLIVVGGEVVSVDSFQQWTRVARPHQVWMNTYGPTEATVICTVYRQGGQASARHALPAYLDAREISYPYAPLLHQLFEAQVQHNPDAIAVVVEDQQLTYAELNKKTNQLAHTLRAQGVGPDQLVAICVERSLEMVIGLLGILKAGGAYVPLEPSYPAERLAQMVKDAAPRVLLTQERFAALLPAHGGRTILLDSQWAEMAGQEDSNLAAEVIGLTAANLAYVIYTSGSTGQPKGAMNEHRAVVNRLRWMQDQYGLTANDKVLQKTPFSFDVSVWEFFWPLLNGASLVFARPEGHQDPAYLRHLIQAQGITTLHFVPSMLQAFLEQTEEPQEQKLTECASLRRIVCSGEELPVALQERCLAALPQASLHNLYGPTEAAIDVTYWECRAGEDLDRVPIGRPIANTQMYILDAGRQLVPTGVAGEIYIGGAGVARGYLHRPALTAERFVADLLSEQPGARMYRTGDLGRWRADGHIEYLGRNDLQVKIRGFRIELGEIEAQLLQQAQVREAVVVARERAGAENQGAEGSGTEGARQEKQLVAYLVGPADGSDASNELSSEALRGQLKAVLPEYMVPAAFVWLPALPLTPNGKLDRKALPAPGQEAFAAGLYAAPQGEVEVLLAGIWQTLLGLERVGRHDHFFDLGGHSLLALQLLTRVRQGLGRELALRELFAHPTIAALAKVLAGQDMAVLAAEEIGRADRALPLPLSFAQQRLWFFGQLEGASAAYHMSVALRLQGTLDVAALQAALDTIIERHEALRTVFVSVEDNPVQVISEDAHFPLQLVDLSNWVVTEREAEVNRQVAEETHNRFDLGTGPLIRGRLIKLAGDEHVLSLAIHHIVSDGWSIGILLREIAVLYGAYQQGLANPLPRLPVQYADYAVWQRAWLQGEVLETQSAYWKQKLAGAPALLELPTDRVRPPVQSYQGGSVSLALGAELSSQLRALSRKNGATLFMTLYAGLSILLSRLSGQDDVVIGTPIANRNRAELEGLIGFFVNTLALRTQLNDKMSVSELLKQVKETTLSAYSHQDLPFEQVVEAIQPVRSLSSSAVFQVMLVLDNTPQSTQSLPGLNFAPQGMSNDTEQFDLSLSLQEAGDQIVGAFSYASDLFDRATVARWTEHFRQVLTAMVQDDTQTLGAIDMLRPEERQQIVAGFNAAKTDFAQDQVIQQWFEAQVEKTPDAIAIVFEEKYLTYAELNCRANQVARYLREQGVRPDQLVGISLEASLEVVVAMLGVLKSGAAYLPLDPSYPADRLAYMLQDASPVMVLTQAKLVTTLPASNAKVLTLDQGWAEIAKYGRANLDAGELGLSSSHLAYVIYTSGSTGKPKGVMIEHRQLVSLVGALQRTYALDANDRVLQFAALSFDMSVEEYFGSLCSGSTLTLRTDAWLGGGSVFWQHCINAGITILNLPTAFWHQLVIESHIPVPEAIRQIMIGGEKVSAEFVARWFLREGHLPRLVNAYGPTEATVDAAICVITDAVVSSRLIGRPLPNTCIYILDSHGAAVPIGVTGEVYIGGAGVARGYLNRPRLTAERFILDTFSDEPGARLYQTGDLGRFKADGNIEYLGRNDHQVKIRGFRIELGEIELQLSRHPSVKEAVVIAREDIPGEKRLVAYLIQDEAFAASEVANIEELRSHLKSALPDYMVPAAFVRLRVLPLTPNGKLDRKALPAPEMDAFAAKIYEAPQGETEVILAGIWQDLLHVERVGRNDNFFELGGHSLLAVQLMTHIRQGLGREVTLRQLFEYPTVHALSLHLTSARAISIADIEPADRSQPLLLSWAQQRLWFIDQLDGGGAAYHMPDALRLSGRLDRAALQSALNAMVERHEALRTVFSQAGGYPTQVVLSDVQFPLPLIDLEHCEAEEREALVKRHTAEEAVARFDLSTGPLIRGRLLCLSDEEHVLLITTHHIVSDGWSESILMEELAEFYSASRDDRPHRLPALPIQYPDYAAWQRQWLQGDILQNQLDYWKNHLGGAPALLELPTDRVRPADQNHRGGSVVFTLDQQLTRQLNDFTRQHDATLFITLYTGFAILLSGLSGQDDVVIGTPTANRQRTEVEGLIGFFVNTLALRADLSDNPSVRNLIRQIKFMTLDAYSHQDLPFEQVVDALQPPRSLRHSPLFQVMLVLQNNAQSDFNLPGLTVAPHDIPYDIEQFDMTLSMREVDGYLVGSFSYVTDLFDRSTIERWVGYFKNVLAAMVDDAEQGVKSIDVLDDEERHRLVLDLNATAMDFPEQKSLHGLFEEQVEKTPDAIALVRDGQRISYRELNRRANRVAHTLLARGVTAEACVGICLPRTAECIVSLLGVLKAGACYVPIDPAYPASRVEYLLGDADMAALITTTALQRSLDIDAAKALCVDDHNAWQDRFDNPGFAVSSRQLAYVIYTSGSTGRPKGVPLSHQGGVSLLHWACSVLPESDRTGILAGTSLCFDLSIYELFLPLTTGHTCILIDNILALENLDEASRQQITLINTVPSAAKALLDRQTFPPSVRVLNLAGEPLRANLVDRLYAETGIGHVYDLYGPSEGTTYSSFALRQSRAAETIGRPVANNQFYVLSKEGQLVPQGVIGELYIGGVGLARGYLQRPGLTAEKFVPNRFSTTAGDRLYRTGDLVRYRANGDLEYLGRADHQVKVRGFRIELGEIESACLQHSGIKDAVVIVREDNPDNRQIVAYVVVKQEPVPGADPVPESLLATTEIVTGDGVDTDAGGDVETEAGANAENDIQLALIDSLKARLKQALPGFMMPSAFVILPEIPLTPNGKLDRKALPAPDGSDAVQGYVAPEGDVETRIAAVWEDILKRTQIGRYDNFFDLGGHSLIAVVAVSRMRQVGLNIALDAFFKHPTVKTMAEFIMFGDETRLWMGGAVVMREQGEQRPLFLVHEITGDIFPLFPLSRYLREGIPVYGLPLTKDSCRDSVPGLAAQHLQAIRKIQPKGPYRVAGHSFGGVLSYEIATQIVASGEEVEFLGLIDTYRPYFKQGWADEVTDLKVLLIYVEILHPGLAAERWAILHAAKTAAEALEHCKVMGLFPEELGLTEVLRWADNMSSILVMGANYEPKPLAVPTFQFTAEAEALGDRDWSPLIGDSLHVIHVGGTHLGITQEPVVQTLALAMSQALPFTAPTPIDENQASPEGPAAVS